MSLFGRRKNDVARHLRDAQFRIAIPRSASPRVPKRGPNVAQKSHRADPRRLHISQSNIVTSLFSTCGACSKTVQNVVEKTLPDLPMPCKGGHKRAPKSTTPTAFRPRPRMWPKRRSKSLQTARREAGGRAARPGSSSLARSGGLALLNDQ